MRFVTLIGLLAFACGEAWAEPLGTASVAVDVPKECVVEDPLQLMSLPYWAESPGLGPMAVWRGGVPLTLSEQVIGVEDGVVSSEGALPPMAMTTPVVPMAAPAVVALPNSTGRSVWVLGAQQMLPTEDLLPAPNSANDLFYVQLDPAESRLPAGWSPVASVALTGDPLKPSDLWTRFKALPSFGAAYDTGVFNSDVQNIALGNDPAAGQTSFSGNGELKDVPIQLLGDAQLTNALLLGVDQQVQVLVQADNFDDSNKFRVGQLYGRMWDYEQLTVGAGMTFSLFSVAGVLPATLSQNTELIGAGSLTGAQPAQFRIQRSSPRGGGWGGGIAIEDPYDSDFTVTGTKLTRWPTLASNVVRMGANQVDRVQMSAIVRSLGFQADDGLEHFDTGWGLSAYTLIATHLEESRVEGLYAGVVGGEGIGQYIHGVSTSAIFNGSDLTSLEGLGSYVGLKEQWITAGDREFGVNLAYGYAHMQTPASVADNTNRQLHQAWANLLYFPTDNVAVGVEYQYGSRETRVGEHGENNRFMFVIALTSADSRPASAPFLTKQGLSAAKSYDGGSTTEAAGIRTGASRQSL